MAFVQTFNGTALSGDTTIAATSASGVNAGELIVAFVNIAANTSITVTDGRGGTLAPISTQLSGVGGLAGTRSQTFWELVPSGSGTITVTATFGATVINRNIQVVHYNSTTGWQLLPSGDLHANGTAAGGTPIASLGPMFAYTNDLLIAASVDSNNGQFPQSPFTDRTGSIGNLNADIGDYTVATPGAQLYTTNFQSPNAGDDLSMHVLRFGPRVTGPVIVQQTTATTTAGTTLTVNFNAAVNGNRLIIAFGVNDVIANVTGPAGWTRANNIDGTTLNCSIWQKLAAGGETSAVFTTAAGKNSQGVMWEINGLTDVGTTPLGDRTATGAGTGTSVTQTAVSANQWPDDWEMCLVETANSGGAFVSNSAGWINDTGANGLGATNTLYVAHRIPLAFETVSNTLTWTTSRTFVALCVSWRGGSTDIVFQLETS